MCGDIIMVHEIVYTYKYIHKTHTHMYMCTEASHSSYIHTYRGVVTVNEIIHTYTNSHIHIHVHRGIVMAHEMVYTYTNTHMYMYTEA